jgi:hypothetical protein
MKCKIGHLLSRKITEIYKTKVNKKKCCSRCRDKKFLQHPNLLNNFVFSEENNFYQIVHVLVSLYFLFSSYYYIYLAAHKYMDRDDLHDNGQDGETFVIVTELVFFVYMIL